MCIRDSSFSGPHPAGNVGVQIHAISPINKGDLVWTVSVQAVSYTHLRAHETVLDLVCRLLLETKKKTHLY